MSKTVLIVVGLLVLAMGILGIIPAIEWLDEPSWYAIAQIIIGFISLGVAVTDKPATPMQ